MRMYLFNRDRNKVWLEEVGDNGWWQLRTDIPSYFDYTNITYEENGDGIYAVDPPGGPFLSIGYRIGMTELKITEIRKTSLGIFIRLETLINIDENK